MKHKYSVQIRGNVEYAGQGELQSAVSAKLLEIAGFTLISRSVEAWQENGIIKKQDSGLYRFTVQLSGNLLAESDSVVETLIASFCIEYPEFTLTYQSITAWQDGSGGLKVFNDDGTEYAPLATPDEEDEKFDPVLEDIVKG